MQSLFSCSHLFKLFDIVIEQQRFTCVAIPRFRREASFYWCLVTWRTSCAWDIVSAAATGRHRRNLSTVVSQFWQVQFRPKHFLVANEFSSFRAAQINNQFFNR